MLILMNFEQEKHNIKSQNTQGIKWLEMRALHLKGEKKKNQDKYLSTVLLKDSFSSQTWRNWCKTNMLAATICVSSFLCSVCQGKKKQIYDSLFSKDAASSADIYRLFFRKTCSLQAAHWISIFIVGSYYYCI